MIDVSIIIVNYNTSSLVNDAIQSIYEKTKGVSFEIIVIDNNTENLKAKIFNSNRPEIKILQMNENLGFGRANNEGVKIANGRNILFLNPDTKLLNNAVKVLSDFLDSNLDCGICGGNLFDSDLMPTRSFRRVYPSKETLIWSTFLGVRYERFKAHDQTFFNSTDAPIQVAYIVGADLMARKRDLEYIGSFNPIFFMYYEEIELCHRFSKNGYRIINVPHAKIQHLEGKSGSVGKRKATLHYQSSQNYFRLTMTPAQYRDYRKILGYFILIRRIIGKILRRKNMVTFWETWRDLYNQEENSGK